MNAKYGFVLAAVAALCLLAAPAFSMPGSSGSRHGGNSPNEADNPNAGNCPMTANFTAEDMGNMTLGQLKEMQTQARNNTTSCPMGQADKNCSFDNTGANGRRDHNSESMSGRGMDESSGQFGKQDNSDMNDASSLLLLDSDITIEKLNNMTVNQIRDLKESKVKEMDGMTLNEIRDLREKKTQEMNNMSLNDISEEKNNIRQISRILNAVEASSAQA